MALTPYEQITNAVGGYPDVDTGVTAAVTVQLVDGLTMALAADRQFWVNGPLTYTATIDNTSGVVYTTPDVTFILEPSVVSFTAGSVKIDDVVAAEGTDPGEYEYTEATSTLVVHLDTVADAASTKVEYQVERA
ncbi:MAG: hypothetical protein LBV27_05535 [Oscillospiraceae bacterium]|jgi:hypothetical protein|nr:hypothetical protein [Oscillospiraceae bacterium]